MNASVTLWLHHSHECFGSSFLSESTRWSEVLRPTVGLRNMLLLAHCSMLHITNCSAVLFTVINEKTVRPFTSDTRKKKGRLIQQPACWQHWPPGSNNRLLAQTMRHGFCCIQNSKTSRLMRTGIHTLSMRQLAFWSHEPQQQLKQTRQSCNKL